MPKQASWPNGKKSNRQPKRVSFRIASRASGKSGHTLSNEQLRKVEGKQRFKAETILKKRGVPLT